MQIVIRAILRIDPTSRQARLLRANVMETSSIMVEKCYHDEIPPKPCEQVFSWSKK